MDAISLIKKVAADVGIDENLLIAICTVESSLNPLAIRFEPAWKYFYFPRETASALGLSNETETVLQSCSYGLNQIMGSVAREIGFRGNLTSFFQNPELPLKHGAIHLKQFLQKYGNENDAISSYNQGSNRKTDGGMYQNQHYVDKVHAELIKLRKLT